MTFGIFRNIAIAYGLLAVLIATDEDSGPMPFIALAVGAIIYAIGVYGDYKDSKHDEATSNSRTRNPS